MEGKIGKFEGVDVTMELTGEYQKVVSKLQMTEPTSDLVVPILTEIDDLLDVLNEMNGGTRSAIGEELPSEMIIVKDGKVVPSVLNLLKRYGLVALEGNTWTPGKKS